MKVKNNGVDWDAIDIETGEKTTSGDVSPTEIQGTWGFFSVPSLDHALIPESLLRGAFTAARVRPRVTPDGDEYYAIHRSALVHRVLVLEPVPQREAGDEKAAEESAMGAYVRQYKGLDNVRIESRAWSKIGISFPSEKDAPATTLVAWLFGKCVYVSRPIDYANWRLTEQGMEQDVRELRQLRLMREFRNGFPGMSFAEKKRR